MNLHMFASPVVAAVNPPLPVAVRASVGQDAGGKPAYATPGTVTASIGATFTASVAGTAMTVSAVAAGVVSPNDALSGSDGANSLPEGAYVLSQTSGSPGGAGVYQIGGVPAGQVLNPCTVTSASTVLNVTALSKGVVQPGQTVSGSGIAAETLVTAQGTGQGGAGTYEVSAQQTVAPGSFALSMTLTAQMQPLAASDLRHMDMLNLQGSHRAFYFNGMIRGIVRVSLKGGDLLTLPDGQVFLVNQPLEQWQTAGWSKVIATLQDGS